MRQEIDTSFLAAAAASAADTVPTIMIKAPRTEKIAGPLILFFVLIIKYIESVHSSI
jgi:hypothetical protein